jgi:hypothetical protein
MLPHVDMLPHVVRHVHRDSNYCGRVHSVMVVEAFRKNNNNYAASQPLFRRHFQINRNNPLSSAHAIKTWIEIFKKTALDLKKAYLDTKKPQTQTELLYNSP